MSTATDTRTPAQVIDQAHSVLHAAYPLLLSCTRLSEALDRYGAADKDDPSKVADLDAAVTEADEAARQVRGMLGLTWVPRPASASTSLRDYLAGVFDDAAGYRGDRAGESCAACRTEASGWCGPCLDMFDLAEKYTVTARALSEAPDDAAAVAIVAAANLRARP